MDDITFNEVRRILAGMRFVFDAVEYVYGPEASLCQPGFYAYVISNPPNNKNEDGEFRIFLCDAYFVEDENEQIETLAHEASHHETMLQIDASFAGKTLYGGNMCKKAAQTCATTNNPNGEACKAIRQNADTLAFFVADANNRFDEEEQGAVSGLNECVGNLEQCAKESPEYFVVAGGVVALLMCIVCCCCIIRFQCGWRSDKAYSSTNEYDDES